MYPTALMLLFSSAVYFSAAEVSINYFIITVFATLSCTISTDVT